MTRETKVRGKERVLPWYKGEKINRILGAASTQKLLEIHNKQVYIQKCGLIHRFPDQNQAPKFHPLRLSTLFSRMAATTKPILYKNTIFYKNWKNAQDYQTHLENLMIIVSKLKLSNKEFFFCFSSLWFFWSCRCGLGGKVTTMFKHSCLLLPADQIQLEACI